MTALVQAGLEVFLLLFALVGKKNCFLLPASDEWRMVHGAWCIKILDTHVQNAISLVFLDISLCYSFLWFGEIVRIHWKILNLRTRSFVNE